jgi:threonine/homoserine efflux transporter RhtA
MEVATEPAPWARSGALQRVPPEVLFVISAISQYVGAVVAIRRFHEVRPATVAWLRVVGAAITLLVVGARSLKRFGVGPVSKSSRRSRSGSSPRS